VSLVAAPLQGRRRILILGCGGAGKSTLARQLGDRLGLPVVHLDIHYWSFGWKPTPEVEWRERLERLATAEAWVMDGNYSASLATRLARCDAIVFLDLPRWLCVLSVLLRWFRYRFAARPDLPEGCPEKLDLEFLSWVWNFRQRSRQKVLDAIEHAGRDVEVLRLTQRAQTRALLASTGCIERAAPPAS
jgi:adenylate kinase family enzyme